jgi:hypothetical protein
VAYLKIAYDFAYDPHLSYLPLVPVLFESLNDDKESQIMTPQQSWLLAMDDPQVVVRCYSQCAIVISTIVLIAMDFTLWPLFLKEPYHTSVLTGEAWVLELLAGHPECIHCELRVYHHIFNALISEL